MIRIDSSHIMEIQMANQYLKAIQHPWGHADQSSLRFAHGSKWISLRK